MSKNIQQGKPVWSKIAIKKDVCIILTKGICNVKHLYDNKIVDTKFYCHIRKSEKLFGLGLFLCEDESKSCDMSAKSCGYNSNFDDNKVFTVNTNSSLWVRVKKP